MKEKKFLIYSPHFEDAISVVFGTNMKWYNEYKQIVIFDGEEDDDNIIAVIPYDHTIIINRIDDDEEDEAKDAEDIREN